MSKSYSMKEFLEATKMSRQTVYNWIKWGLISDQLFAGKRVFTQEDVDKVPENKKITRNKRWNLKN